MVSCTFLYLYILQRRKQIINFCLLLNALLEGNLIQGQSLSEHPFIHDGVTSSYQHQATVRTTSFVLLAAACAVTFSGINLVTHSAKRAGHLVQFNRKLWEIRAQIRTARTKCSAEASPFLPPLIILTLCKNRLSSYFLSPLSMWMKWPNQTGRIFKWC